MKKNLIGDKYDWFCLTSHTMKRIAYFILLLILAGTASAQTIIDLSKGGKVRNKTTDDYNLDEAVARRIKKDSLAYNDRLTLAFNALNADSLSEAETLFKEALKLRPDAKGNHVVRANLGRIAYVRNDYRKAEDYFSEALKADPDMDDVRFLRARSYHEMKDYRRSLDDCKILIDSKRGDVNTKQVRFLKSAAEMQLRLYADATRDLEAIVYEDPENTSARLLLALVDEYDGRPQMALERLDALIQGYPELPDARTARAELLFRMGYLDRALLDYESAISANPSDGSLYVGRARIFITQKRMSAARKDLDSAVAAGVSVSELQSLYRALTK